MSRVLEVCALYAVSSSLGSQPALLPCDYFFSVSRLLPFFLCSFFLSHTLKMSSGVSVNDRVKTIYNEMKLNRTNADASKKIRLVTLKVGETEVDVEQVIREEDLPENADIFKHFCSLMPEKECSYILYDCHFVTAETYKEELVFAMWVHDKAPIKKKMKYASSKLYITKIVDAKHDCQFNDLDEQNLSSFAEKLTKVERKKIISIEGTPL